MKDPLVVAFTLPSPVKDEAEKLTTLLRSESIDRVHIRKLDLPPLYIRRLISGIPSELHSRLSIHYHFDIAEEFGCGINLNPRNPDAPEKFCGIVSRSCHSLEEALQCNGEDYVFLSPIYPSISKPGYVPTFNLTDLRGKIDRRMVALGGITLEKIPDLIKLGFGGVAMLGEIWRNENNGQHEYFLKNLRKIKEDVAIYNSPEFSDE